MAGINVARVLLGGLVAGLILNVGEYALNDWLLGDDWAVFRGRAGLPGFGVGQSAALFAIILLFGVVLIWIYAAIRPRFGPGAGTAVIAGLTLWSIAWLLLSASFYTAGMLTAKMTVLTIAWGAVEVPIAALAGAWLYREGSRI